MGVPPNGWFMMENAIKMDDLGVLANLIIKLYLDNIPVLLLDSGFFFGVPRIRESNKNHLRNVQHLSCFFWSQMMGTTKSYLDIGWIILVYPADLRLMFSFMNPSGNPQDANQPAAIFHWFSVGFCGDMCHDFTSYKPPFSSWFFS